VFALVMCVVLCGALSPSCAQSSGDGDELEPYRLSLNDALRMALKNNLDLVSARYGPEFAAQDIELQDSGFDPTFQTSYARSERVQPATQLSTVTGSESDNFAAIDFGINKNVSTGPNVVAPTSYLSGFTLTYNQPLLNGFGTEVTTEQLILAYNDYDISLADLEVNAEQTMEIVEGAYWDVVAAREALRIARISLQRAEDLLELNKKKVEVGTLAPIEITQAEAGVASQEEQVIVAEVTLRDAEDELRRLLAIPPDDTMWDKAIVNDTRPVFEATQIDLQEAIDTAMEARAEVRSAEQRLRNRELSERVAQRQKRHNLDLNLLYGPSGASLDLEEIDDGMGNILLPANEATLSDSLSNIFDGDVYNWSAGITYRVPIGNRAAKANYANARLARSQAGVDLLNQEQTVRVEVRRAVRNVESGIKRVEAARKNVELQQEKLEAEQKKFDNGMSTSFEVLTFQNDLADAELSEVRARLDYIKSLAGLERAKGTLLEARGLSLDLGP
jgi:outer membrane protein TolC